MMKYRLGALVAAGLLAGGMSASGSTSAFAADLGGNCCADLEERIAELEATTARKGNRKVSLTITGWVSQQVMWWDDGHERNIYVTDTGSVSIGTHVKFTGQATIVPGYSAGYVLNLEPIQNDSLLVTQHADNGVSGNAMALVANGGSFPSGLGFNNSGVAIESSYWFVKSDHWGKFSVGKQSSAADNQAILPDGSGTLVVANYVMYDVNNFNIRTKNGGFSGLNWGSVASCAPLDGGGGVSGDCDGYPSNNMRYDSNVYEGFSVSASWGEDDQWAVSARYAGEWRDFKVAVAAAYNKSTDENGPGSLLIIHDNLDASAFQVGAYAEHIPTGLWVYGAWTREHINELVDSPANPFFGDASDKPEGNEWYIKAGLRQHCFPLGHTVWYGEYGQNNDRMNSQVFLSGVTNTQERQWGLGVVQEIDAAAMSVWLGWRHYTADATCNSDAQGSCFDTLNFGHNDLENMDIIKSGALINF